jgi:hypothetical protein
LFQKPQFSLTGIVGSEFIPTMFKTQPHCRWPDHIERFSPRCPLGIRCHLLPRRNAALLIIPPGAWEASARPIPFTTCGGVECPWGSDAPRRRRMEGRNGQPIAGVVERVMPAPALRRAPPACSSATMGARSAALSSARACTALPAGLASIGIERRAARTILVAGVK